MAEFLIEHKDIVIIIAAVIIVMAAIMTFVIRSASMYWQKHWPEDQSRPDKDREEI